MAAGQWVLRRGKGWKPQKNPRPGRDVGAKPVSSTIATISTQKKNPMNTYQSERTIASRDFVVTPYHADSSGRMVGECPSQGPCRGRDARSCRVRINHYRKRRTGPRHRLTVVRCLTHRQGFTLYPPGHVPHGREPVVCVAPDGSGLDRGEEREPQNVHSHFEGTYFEAALDGAAGKYWDPRVPQQRDQWWATQRRRISRALDWLGIAPGTDGDVRELICAALEVDQLLLEVTAKGVADFPGYRGQSQAVRDVLDAVCKGPCILDRLLFAGHLAGLWGRPLRWDASAQVLRSPPFQRPGTPAADRRAASLRHQRL